MEHLTRLEERVLFCIMLGMNNKEITIYLQRRPYSVRCAVSRLYRKTGAMSREQLYKCAVAYDGRADG